MGFMSTYKRLDNLCRDMNGKGVSGYLEDMEACPGAESRILHWRRDYDALKHYRWVRNQIAHEAYAEEDTLCEDGDEEWLAEFHSRILNQTDPLALYYEDRKARTASKERPRTTPAYTAPPQNMGCGTLLLLAALPVLFLLFLL